MNEETRILAKMIWINSQLIWFTTFLVVWSIIIQTVTNILYQYVAVLVVGLPMVLMARKWGKRIGDLI